MYVIDLDQIRGLVAERNQLAEEVARLRRHRDHLWWALASALVSAERIAEAEQTLRQFAPGEEVE
ncbi:MAG: hypothetical protein ACOYYF_12715 [Chloroflexota bacterium]